MLAIVRALQSVHADVRDCRVDVQVDSKVVIDTFQGQGSKSSPQLTLCTKELFFLLCKRNIQLKLYHVPSGENPADGPSRVLSLMDTTLSFRSWALVEECFGGVSGHTFDLMALDSNTALGRDGEPLPHFTPCASPGSWGVNLFAQDLTEERFPLSNPYVFPPFSLVAPVMRFLGHCKDYLCICI